MAARLEPGAQKCDVRRTPNSVSAFNDDQLTAVFFMFDAGQRRAVKDAISNLC